MAPAGSPVGCVVLHFRRSALAVQRLVMESPLEKHALRRIAHLGVAGLVAQRAVHGQVAFGAEQKLHLRFGRDGDVLGHTEAALVYRYGFTDGFEVQLVGGRISGWVSLESRRRRQAIRG